MAVERLPKLNFSIPFAMTSALPLDANSYFESLEAAMTAAEAQSKLVVLLHNIILDKISL